MSSYHFTSAEFAPQPVEPSLVCPPLEPMPCAALDSQSDWALLGESLAVRRLLSQIHRVAPYFRMALIRGEQGAGKEVVARAIHALSSVGDRPFIVVDACALAESLDHGKASPPCSNVSPGPGSASTAAELFESTRGGTLYITRVGELSLSHQAALFRLLQAFEDGRSGMLHPNHARMVSPGVSGAARGNIRKIRIIASSCRDLRTLAAIGQFRKDLYTRLSVLELLVPPLRDRIDDIPTLTERLLHRLADESGKSPTSLSESAMIRLQQHSWPENVRELKRVITQAAELTNRGTIEACHVLPSVEPHAPLSTAVKSDRLQDMIQQHVLQVLMHCEGNKVRAAELLGISRSTLYRMLSATTAAVRLVE